MTAEDARLLRNVRRALADPFSDPVKVDRVEMSRATARFIERRLARQKVKAGL